MRDESLCYIYLQSRPLLTFARAVISRSCQRNLIAGRPSCSIYLGCSPILFSMLLYDHKLYLWRLSTTPTQVHIVQWVPLLSFSSSSMPISLHSMETRRTSGIQTSNTNSTASCIILVQVLMISGWPMQICLHLVLKQFASSSVEWLQMYSL